MTQLAAVETNREHFGRCIADALAAHEMRQLQLAEALDTTQSCVSAWIRGKTEPSAETVWEIEAVLGFTPGQLSQFLGYLPISALGTTPSVEEAITNSPDFVDDSKRMLVQIVRTVAAKDRAILNLSGRQRLQSSPGR